MRLIQDDTGFLMTADTPDINASPESLLQNMGSASTSGGGTAVVTSQSASFKRLGFQRVLSGAGILG